MDLRQIKNLMKEFEDSKIYKLEIKDKDFSISLEKENNNFLGHSNLPLSSSTMKTLTEEDKEEVIIENENYLIKAPLVGIFYCAPSPDSEPFVRVNQKVNKGDVLFIVEAMKVMNEITSPVSGTIAKINIKDATMIEFDQVVLEIKE